MDRSQLKGDVSIKRFGIVSLTSEIDQMDTFEAIDGRNYRQQKGEHAGVWHSARSSVWRRSLLHREEKGADQAQRVLGPRLRR